MQLIAYRATKLPNSNAQSSIRVSQIGIQFLFAIQYALIAQIISVFNINEGGCWTQRPHGPYPVLN